MGCEIKENGHLFERMVLHHLPSSFWDGGSIEQYWYSSGDAAKKRCQLFNDSQ